MVGELAHPEDQAEADREQDGEERHLQGLPEPVHEQHAEVVGGDEGFPELVAELVTVDHPPDDEPYRDGEEDGSEHGVETVPGDGLRSGVVVENGAHRTVLHRLSRVIAPADMISTMMM